MPLPSAFLAALAHENTRENDAAALYERRKRTSIELDAAFGFRIEECERAIRARETSHENWARLSPQVFQTPYGELAEIVTKIARDLRPDTWVDLGAAYGRLGLVLAALQPSARFIGIELEPERVDEGCRVYREHDVANAELLCANLEEAPLPAAAFYFVYDFGNRPAVERVLCALREIARTGAITVVGRGRRVRDAIESAHPWLADVVPPEHSVHYSIYRSA